MLQNAFAYWGGSHVPVGILLLCLLLYSGRQVGRRALKGSSSRDVPPRPSNPATVFNTKRVHFATHVKEKRYTLQPFFVLCQHKNMQKLGEKKDQEEKKATNKAELALFQKQTVRGWWWKRPLPFHPISKSWSLKLKLAPWYNCIVGHETPNNDCV